MIYIAIPNYNGVEHLKDCLPSLIKQTYKDYKIFIVDNGSSDGSLNYIVNNFPDTEIIPLKYNSGFAYATNLVVENALASNKCKFILFLNNDIECDKYFLEQLISGFVSEEIGSVGCKMMNYYERDRIDVVGDYFNLFSYPFRRGEGEIDKGQFNKRGYIFGGCGGATMYRIEVFRKIGLLDNSFFAYYEDIDFNYRMQLSGFKCVYAPEAICYHKLGATIKLTHSKKFFLMERNLTFIQVKNFSLKFLFKYSIISVLNRFYNYLRYIKYRQFSFFANSVIGFFTGLFLSFSYLKKRKLTKEITSVSNTYMENIAMDFKKGYKEFNKY